MLRFQPARVETQSPKPPSCDPAAESSTVTIDPAMKDFIESVIVPALIERLVIDPADRRLPEHNLTPRV